MYNTHYPRFRQRRIRQHQVSGRGVLPHRCSWERRWRENGIATGDTVLVESPHGSVLRIACVSPPIWTTCWRFPMAVGRSSMRRGIDAHGRRQHPERHLMQVWGAPSFNSRNNAREQICGRSAGKRQQSSGRSERGIGRSWERRAFISTKSLCSGCHSCMMVCKENHHLPEGGVLPSGRAAS